MFQILVTVILVCQLRRWNSRKPTRSGRHLSTSVGGSNVVKGDGQYPRFLEQHLVLVGYEHTQMGNCSGRACKLNDGREPIKVGSCISACACIRSTVNVNVFLQNFNCIDNYHKGRAVEDFCYRTVVTSLSPAMARLLIS